MFNKIMKVESIGIISDGIISNVDINDGTFLPAVIIHHRASQQFTELVEIHRDQPAGEVKATWGWHPINKAKIFLNLEFKRPSKATIAIRLDAADEFSIIEGVRRYKALYIIVGEYGDKPSSTYGKKPMLLIEITPSLFESKWDNIALEAITKKFRKTAASKKSAKESAKEHMKSVRAHLEFNRKAWQKKYEERKMREAEEQSSINE